MSYSSLLRRSSTDEVALEKCHKKRIAQINKSVSIFYDALENRAIEKEKNKIQKKRIRTLVRRLRDEEKKYKNAIKELKTGKTQALPPKKQTTTKIKGKAYASFQLYCRLLRADKDGMVRLLDTGKLVHYSKSQWGHYRSKHNHPNLGFEVMNCRPISPLGNKMQWDQPWYYWRDELINRIWQEMYDHLEMQAKKHDTIIRDRRYREEQYKIRHKKSEELRIEKQL